MSEVLREEEYDATDGERVKVRLEKYPHKSAERIHAYHLNEDGSRMSFDTFVVQGGNRAAWSNGTFDEPTKEIIAAVHEFGYEIPNVERSILQPESSDLSQIGGCLDAATFYRAIAETTTSEYVELHSSAMAELSEVLAANLLTEIELEEQGDHIDDRLMEKNRRMVEAKGSGPETHEEILTGIFTGAIQRKNIWTSTQKNIEHLREVHREIERETFLDV